MVEEEAAVCNSIANCNCSVYSYHSVARFRSDLHQKHWHRKHLRWRWSRGGRRRHPSLLVYSIVCPAKRVRSFRVGLLLFHLYNYVNTPPPSTGPNTSGSYMYIYHTCQLPLVHPVNSLLFAYFMYSIHSYR